MTSEEKQAPEKSHWLDAPRNVNKIVFALYAVCALLVLADLFYHKHIQNESYNFENWFGFFGFFGFVGCIGLVLAAKLMRVVLKRDEDYYDD